MPTAGGRFRGPGRPDGRSQDRDNRRVDRHLTRPQPRVAACIVRPRLPERRSYIDAEPRRRGVDAAIATGSSSAQTACARRSRVRIWPRRGGPRAHRALPACGAHSETSSSVGHRHVKTNLARLAVAASILRRDPARGASGAGRVRPYELVPMKYSCLCLCAARAIQRGRDPPGF